jgi:hypothetical protein
MKDDVSLVSFVGWDLVHFVRWSLIVLLYQPQMVDRYGEIGGMRIGRGNWNTRSKPTPVSPCPLHIAHVLTWDRNRAVAVEKAATNRLSYDTAITKMPVSQTIKRRMKR